MAPMNLRLLSAAVAPLLAVQLSSPAFAAPGVPARVDFKTMPDCAKLPAPEAPDAPEWHGRLVVGVKAGVQGGQVSELDIRLLEQPADLSRQVQRAVKNNVMAAMSDWRCAKDLRSLEVTFTFDRP